jgi:hypothetical protein
VKQSLAARLVRWKRIYGHKHGASFLSWMGLDGMVHGMEFDGCLFYDENKKLDDVEEQSDLDVNGAGMH